MTAIRHRTGMRHAELTVGVDVMIPTHVAVDENLNWRIRDYHAIKTETNVERYHISEDIAVVDTTVVQTLRNPKDLSSIEAEWNDLHNRAAGTVFQSYTWLSKWWEVYGDRGNALNIITVRIDGRLSAILPLYVEKTGLPGLSLKRIRMMGIYETYGEYTILIDPSQVPSSVKAVATELAGTLRQSGSNLLSMFRFPPGSVPMDALMRELRALGLETRFVPKVIPRVLMDLPGTWEEYLASLSSNERESIRRKTKVLQNRGADFQVITSTDPLAFADYVHLHNESWHPRGVSGYFASRDFKAFLERVTLSMLETGQSRLYFLVKDGVRFAAVHAFFVNRECCFYLSGLDRNHPMANMSPGKVLLTRVIRDAIEEGYEVFDFQGGDEDYKIRLGGKLSSFAKLLCWSPGRGSFRVLTFLGVQAAHQGLRWRINEKLVPAIKTILGKVRPGRSTNGRPRA